MGRRRRRGRRARAAATASSVAAALGKGRGAHGEPFASAGALRMAHPSRGWIGAAARIARMSDVVMYADTVRSPELRHEVPLLVVRPVRLRGANGSRHGVRRVARDSRCSRRSTGSSRFAFEELGDDELIAAGLGRSERDPELRAARLPQARRHAARPCRGAFPLYIADHLRANGRRARDRRRALRPAPPRQERGRAGGDQAGRPRDRAGVREGEGAARRRARRPARA